MMMMMIIIIIIHPNNNLNGKYWTIFVPKLSRTSEDED
jgi:hypothetical protein